MKFRRSILLVVSLLLVMSLVLTGCGKKPESAVEGFIKTLKQFDNEGMNKYLVESKRDSTSNEQINEELESMLGARLTNYMKEKAEDIDYEIIESEINDDVATVKVNFEYVDTTPLVNEAMDELRTEVNMYGMPSTGDDLYTMFEEIFFSIEDDDKLTSAEKEVYIYAEKVDGDWYVSDFSDDQMLDIITSNIMSALATSGF